MRFDSKHHNFKRIHFATNNHIYLLLSLSHRHQNLQLYHLTSTNYFEEFSLGSVHKINTQVKDFVSIHLKSHLSLQFYNYISYHGIKYTVDDVVVIKRKTKTTLPILAKITTVAYDLIAKVFYLITDDLVTIKYEYFLTGYIVNSHSDSLLKLINIDSLAHYSPIDCQRLKNGDQIVIPKYEI